MFCLALNLSQLQGNRISAWWVELEEKCFHYDTTVINNIGFLRRLHLGVHDTETSDGEVCVDFLYIFSVDPYPVALSPCRHAAIPPSSSSFVYLGKALYYICKEVLSRYTYAGS